MPLGGETGKESPLLEALHSHRKGSILRAASALAGGLEEKEDITYVPKSVWTKLPSSEELISARVVRRERFSWRVDFEDFRMPFQQNVYEKMQTVEVD